MAGLFEQNGNPELTRRGRRPVDLPPTRPAATWRARRSASAPASSGLFAASTTGTSTGAVNCRHDSFTPLGGMIPLVNMKLGEVSPGGVGVGLVGMLINALLAVFIAGLMVGRTPEYLGKKIQAAEMKLVVLYILAMPVAVLVFAGAVGAARTRPWPAASTRAPRPDRDPLRLRLGRQQQRLGLRRPHGDSNWYKTTLGLCMLIGRFFLIIPVAGHRRLAGPQAEGAGHRRAPSRPTPRCSAASCSASIVIVAGLTFFPVLALGPIVEHLSL